MAIALVRQATGVNSNATTITVTITAPTAGNALVLTSSSPNSSFISGVTGGGVTWVLAKQQSSVGTETVSIWYGLNSSGVGTSVVATYGTKGTMTANVSEWSGVATSSALGNTNGAGGSSATINAGAVTTTAEDELVVSAANNFNRGITPSAGPTNSFTALTYVDAGVESDMLAAYNITTASGSYSTEWTVTSGDWGSAIAAFKADGGGGAVGHPAMRRFGGVPGVRGGQFYKGGVTWG